MQYDNAVDVSCKYFEERRYIACLKYTVTKKSTTDTSLVKLTKVVYVIIIYIYIYLYMEFKTLLRISLTFVF